MITSAFGIGSLARIYVINLMVFHFWGVIYSVFCALMAAVCWVLLIPLV